MPAPTDVRKAGKGNEWDKLNKHHTPKLRGSRKALATDVHARLLAPSFPYALCHGNPVDALAVSEPSSTKEMLSRDWGVTNRLELLRQLYWLLQEGHRKDFRTHARAVRQSLVGEEPPRAPQRGRRRADGRVGGTLAHPPLPQQRPRHQRRGLWRVGLHPRGHADRAPGAALGFITDEEAWDTLAIINRALHMLLLFMGRGLGCLPPHPLAVGRQRAGAGGRERPARPQPRRVPYRQRTACGLRSPGTLPSPHASFPPARRARDRGRPAPAVLRRAGRTPRPGRGNSTRRPAPAPPCPSAASQSSTDPLHTGRRPPSPTSTSRPRTRAQSPAATPVPSTARPRSSARRRS